MIWRGKTRCAFDSLHAVEMKDPKGGFFRQAALRMRCELQDLFVRIGKTSHRNANPLHQFKVLELRVLRVLLSWCRVARNALFNKYSTSRFKPKLGKQPERKTCVWYLRTMDGMEDQQSRSHA